jgi:hypothetical protein
MENASLLHTPIQKHAYKRYTFQKDSKKKFYLDFCDNADFVERPTLSQGDLHNHTSQSMYLSILHERAQPCFDNFEAVMLACTIVRIYFIHELYGTVTTI